MKAFKILITMAKMHVVKISSIVLRELQEQNRLFTFIFNYYINLLIINTLIINYIIIIIIFIILLLY